MVNCSMCVRSVKRFALVVLYVLLIATATTVTANASELRYKPINPSFGGDSFNANHLMSLANAQNDFDPPEEPDDLLKNFERTITSSLISRISFEISERILGENAQESGQFQLGSTLLSFQTVGNNVEITIFNGINGESTTITVPKAGL